MSGPEPLNTDAIEPQSFAPDRFWVVVFWIGVVVFASFALPCASMSLLGYPEPLESTAEEALFLCFSAFSGFLAVMSSRAVGQVRNAPLSIDSDGIWRQHLGKEAGLIPWRRVHSARERQTGQRLDLLDQDGERLIQLEYQLKGFERLRATVFSVLRQKHIALSAPAEYGKAKAYHIVSVVGLAGMFAGAVYALTLGLILGPLILAGLLIYLSRHYLREVSGLVVYPQTLELRYPLHKETVDIGKVMGVELIDEFYKSSRVPVVTLTVSSLPTPVRLLRLGEDAWVIHHVLSRWKDEMLFERT